MPQDGNLDHQVSSKMPQDGSKMAPRCLKMPPRWPKMLPRCPKMAPKWLKMTPRGPNDPGGLLLGCRMLQDGSKFPPRGPKMTPNGSNTGSGPKNGRFWVTFGSSRNHKSMIFGHFWESTNGQDASCCLLPQDFASLDFIVDLNLSPAECAGAL